MIRWVLLRVAVEDEGCVHVIKDRYRSNYRGKVFTLSGYESEEYLQKVASYINNKITEYNKNESFKRLTLDMQNVLLQLNIADDYFKAKKQINILEEEIQTKEKELYNLKHD